MMRIPTNDTGDCGSMENFNPENKNIIQILAQIAI